jgi:hypothetical protein
VGNTIFGNPGAPSSETRHFDALFTTSLANYQKTLIDNISSSNVFFKKLQASGGYIGIDGGTNVDFPLMYALGQADWYSGYDTLQTDPMDGLTMSIWQWRECAIPITVSRLELRQNAQKLMSLVDTKITQAEMGFKEFLAKAFLQGAGVSGGSIEDPQVSSITGAQGIEPIASLIRKDPTTSTEIGNINQSTRTWWRNNTKSSSASTYDGFLKEVQGVYNDCSKGPGGPPDMMLCDQYTYQMFERMLYARGGSRHPPATTLEFPFENLKWKNTMVTWDEFVPDVENGLPTPAVDTTTGGTIFFINTKFMKLFYDTQTNFIQTDWKSAYNQPNAKTKHILWMGGTAITNRRKLGVLYGINSTIAS